MCVWIRVCINLCLTLLSRRKMDCFLEQHLHVFISIFEINKSFTLNFVVRQFMSLKCSVLLKQANVLNRERGISLLSAPLPALPCLQWAHLQLSPGAANRRPTQPDLCGSWVLNRTLSTHLSELSVIHATNETSCNVNCRMNLSVA